MADIRKQLGLDYLRGADPANARTEQDGEHSSLGDALLTYGRPMLERLRDSPHESARLYSLIDQLQLPIDIALKVADYLEGRNWLTVVDRDLKGNHELKLTDNGRRLLS